jgi:Tat protein translocase TatC
MSFFEDSSQSEDLFAETRMTFGEHIEDLRRHLIRAIAGFLVALVFSFYPGYYVLEFIKAPVRRQLEAFYANRAKEALQYRDTNEKLKEVNRPQFVKLSFLPQEFKAAQDGRPASNVAPELPAPGQEVSYQELLERAQLQAVAAVNGLNLAKWDVVKEAAARLQQTAARLDQAVKVPADQQDGLKDFADRLAQEASLLRDKADRADADRAALTLQRLQDLLGEKGLVQLWVRLDDPVRFFALFQGALMQVYRRPDLSALSVQEAFMAYFKVCLLCGVVIGSPWIFLQVWSFIAVGLYPREKRLVNIYLPISLGLFFVGVLMCQFVVIPKAIEALLWFNEWLRLEPELRFNEWLSFAILMPLVFGLSFQLPLIMMFLERVGIFTAESYFKRWRIACFLIHVFAAIITPVDFLSMECLAITMFGLYGLGIVLCKLNPHAKEPESDVPESSEMVEA